MAREISFDKNQVIEKCMLQFWSNGYENTSIADLEHCTNLKRTSLYNSFGNKDDIFEAVIQHFINTKCVYWTNILLGEKLFLSGLDNLMTTMINENFDNDLPTGCLITYSAAGINHHCLEIKNAIKQGHRIMLGGIEQGIEKAKENNEISNTVTSENLALFILNSFQGIMVLSKTVGNKESLSLMKNQIIESVKALSKA